MARATRKQENKKTRKQITKQILGKKRINLARKTSQKARKTKPTKMAQIWLITSHTKEFGKE